MKYAKPQVVALSIAVDAIQGQGKEFGPNIDGYLTKPTPAAYEADE